MNRNTKKASKSLSPNERADVMIASQQERVTVAVGSAMIQAGPMFTKGALASMLFDVYRVDKSGLPRFTLAYAGEDDLFHPKNRTK